MERFILRYRGSGTAPLKDVQRIHKTPSVAVLDESSRMLLVEGELPAVEGMIQLMSEWVMVREKTIPLPEIRPTIRKKKH